MSDPRERLAEIERRAADRIRRVADADAMAAALRAVLDRHQQKPCRLCAYHDGPTDHVVEHWWTSERWTAVCLSCPWQHAEGTFAEVLAAKERHIGAAKRAEAA